MGKLKYILKRIITMLITLLIVSFLLFMALHLAGRDPLGVIIGEKQNISDEAREALRQQFYLDRPVLEQYFIWLKGAIHGDFGIDYIQKVSVNSLIGGRAAVSIGMVVLSMLFSIIIAIPLGVVSALKKNTALDSVISFLMLVMTSAPGFMVAMVIRAGLPEHRKLCQHGRIFPENNRTINLSCLWQCCTDRQSYQKCNDRAVERRLHRDL